MAILLGSRWIGDNHPVYIIAEACVNHMGCLRTAKEMALQSKLAGADAVKYQHHLPDEEMLPEVPKSSNFDTPLYEFLKKYSLTLEQHAELLHYCDQIGIQYLCTPFSWKAAQELDQIGVAGFKTGSGEMTNIPMLTRMASLGKPMIVSTGMSTFEEVDRTYNALAALGTPLVLTHCVSEYPPVYEDINLGVIPRMMQRYPKAIIGHSDHTPDIYTCFGAVALGARVIEKHIILDKRVPGPDQTVSIDMRDLANLVDGVRKIEAALKSDKRIHSREAPIREWAFHSLVLTRDVVAGEVLTDDLVWAKRPGTGIPAAYRDRVIGRKVNRDLPANTLLAWSDFEQAPAEAA